MDRAAVGSIVGLKNELVLVFGCAIVGIFVAFDVVLSVGASIAFCRVSDTIIIFE